MKRKALYTREDTAKLLLAGRDWNFHDVDTQEHLHTLHPYPAKFIPQIPRKAILKWTRRGDLVYDPFCGCGTTLLEASLLGRPAIGTDNNAVAILVSKAKVARLTQSSLRELTKFAEHFRLPATNGKLKMGELHLNKNIGYWFSPEVLNRLSALRSLISKTDEPLRTLLMAVFSAIIVKVSYQDSDTRYAKVSRNIAPSDVDNAFQRKLCNVIKILPQVLVPGRAKAKVVQADARKVPFIKTRSVSLIVTSPPYLNAYDYHKYHRQRIHWINGSVAFARDLEIGSHDEFTKPHATPDQYFVDMQECFDEWQRVLKRGGRCLVLIGDAIVSKCPVSVADRYVDLAKEVGLRLEDRWIRELQATKRSFNVWNSRISHEHVLLFRKP